jgi:glycosyltransferase involved in cell wall biosynthesis
MTEPIISICIPTFNRAAFLEKTIKSLVSQKIFIDTNYVEIIISDNFSSDNTEITVMKYKKMFPEKICYYKNNSNIFDKNIEKVLSLGSGKFLKLNNDTLVHENHNSLEQMIETILLTEKSKPIIFFSSNNLGINRSIEINGLDNFLNLASYPLVTWIGAFGIWKEYFKKIKEISRYSQLQLVQTDLFFRLINITKSIFIDDKFYYKTNEPKKKGGYHFVNVFVTNYSFLLNEQLEINQISKNTYKNEMRKTLIYQVAPYMINMYNYPERFIFEKDNSLKIINKYYINRPLLLIYFYYILLKSQTILLISKFLKNRYSKK